MGDAQSGDFFGCGLDGCWGLFGGCIVGEIVVYDFQGREAVARCCGDFRGEGVRGVLAEGDCCDCEGVLHYAHALFEIDAEVIFDICRPVGSVDLYVY